MSPSQGTASQIARRLRDGTPPTPVFRSEVDPDRPGITISCPRVFAGNQRRAK